MTGNLIRPPIQPSIRSVICSHIPGALKLVILVDKARSQAVPSFCAIRNLMQL